MIARKQNFPAAKSKNILTYRAFCLIRQKCLDNFSSDAYGADQSDCTIEIQPGCPKMITRAYHPNALKQDTSGEFAFGRYHGHA